jgi:hypothetical protein
MAAQVPMAPARLSGGNVSVMIDSGNASIAAPPIPCRTRKAMSAPASQDGAQATEPRVKTKMPIMTTRLRP